MRRAVTLLLLAFSPTLLSAQTPKEVLPIPGAANPNLSAAVKAGNLIFFSGQLGTGPGGLVPGGIKAETQKTLDNIKRLVEAAGTTMERLVKCTVFLADIDDFSAMNEVYRTFWPKDPPARSTVAVAGLVLNARIEIECIGLAGK